MGNCSSQSSASLPNKQNFYFQPFEKQQIILKQAKTRPSLHFKKKEVKKNVLSASGDFIKRQFTLASVLLLYFLFLHNYNDFYFQYKSCTNSNTRDALCEVQRKLFHLDHLKTYNIQKQYPFNTKNALGFLHFKKMKVRIQKCNGGNSNLNHNELLPYTHQNCCHKNKR